MRRLSLYPGDADAGNGLLAAKAGQAGAAAVREDREKRRADFDKHMANGTQALKEKQSALAARMFESALLLLPGEESALKSLTDAKLELSKDESEKKKLAEYQAYLDAGRAALGAGRYADAIREFIAAQRVIPGDGVAGRGQQDAEKQLALLQNAEERKKEFFRLMEKAKEALRSRKYDEAIDNATAAQRVIQEDTAPQQLIDDAKKARADARQEYNRLLTAAQAAVNAKQYQQAQTLYGLALQLLPNDPVALQGQQAVQQLTATAQNAVQNAQAGQQAAYAVLMTLGAQAMQARHFREAARTFTEALRLVPNDPDATQGLADAQRALATIDVARTTDFDRLMALGADAMTKRLYRDAVVAYKDALKLAPDNPLALVGLQQARYLRGLLDGQIAFKEKRFGDAVALLEEALREKPGDPVVREALREAKYARDMNDGLLAMNRKKFNEAIVCFQDALREKPNDPTATSLLNQAKKGKN